jgi:hypothetical protein
MGFTHHTSGVLNEFLDIKGFFCPIFTTFHSSMIPLFPAYRMASRHARRRKLGPQKGPLFSISITISETFNYRR